MNSLEQESNDEEQSSASSAAHQHQSCPPDATSRVQPDPTDPSSTHNDNHHHHHPSSSSSNQGDGGGGGTADTNFNSKSTMVSSGPYLTGRNLKRTPSARFQKIRKKVQKLMQPTPTSTDRLDSSIDCDVSGDESTYLDSIKIPLPSSASSTDDEYIK